MARTEVRGGQILDASIDLDADTTGILLVSKGGTGSNTLTNGAVLLGAGTSALGGVSPGSANNVLRSNGTTWESGAVPLPTTVVKNDQNNDLGNFTLTDFRWVGNLTTGTSYTLVDTDTATVRRFSSNSAITVTLPNSLSNRFFMRIIQEGTAQITFSAASGATLNNRQGHTKTAGQWAVVNLIVRTNAGSAAAYVLSGDTGV